MYKLYKTSPEKQEPDAVMFVEDDCIKSFIFDLANTDYQQYLAWLEAGNTPIPADEGEQQ